MPLALASRGHVQVFTVLTWKTTARRPASLSERLGTRDFLKPFYRPKRLRQQTWRFRSIQAISIIKNAIGKSHFKFFSSFCRVYASQLRALLGREVNGHSHRMFCNTHLEESSSLPEQLTNLNLPWCVPPQRSDSQVTVQWQNPCELQDIQVLCQCQITSLPRTGSCDSMAAGDWSPSSNLAQDLTQDSLCFKLASERLWFHKANWAMDWLKIYLKLKICSAAARPYYTISRWQVTRKQCATQWIMPVFQDIVSCYPLNSYVTGSCMIKWDDDQIMKVINQQPKNSLVLFTTWKPHEKPWKRKHSSHVSQPFFPRGRDQKFIVFDLQLEEESDFLHAVAIMIKAFTASGLL